MGPQYLARLAPSELFYIGRKEQGISTCVALQAEKCVDLLTEKEEGVVREFVIL